MVLTGLNPTPAWKNDRVTNPTGFGRPGLIQPSIPKGDVLGTYESYKEAQDVIDHLSKLDFDLKHLSIVGSDLKTVERVTGKLNWGKAALGGAASGAWLGLFFGLVLFLFSATPNYVIVLAAMLIGAGVRRAVRHRRVRDHPPQPRLHLDPAGGGVELPGDHRPRVHGARQRGAGEAGSRVS